MDLLTISYIAKQLGIPESTCRYYRDRFSNYIPSVGEGRNKRYKPEALDVLRTIAEGLRNNLTANQVEDQLLRSYPRNIDGEDQQQQSTATRQQQSAITPYQSLNAMVTLMANHQQTLQQIAAAMEKLANQGEQITSLKEEINCLREIQECQDNERRIGEAEREQNWRDRDQQLMETIRKLQQQGRSRSRRPWWKFWKDRD